VQLAAGTHKVLVEAQDQGTPPNPPTQALVEVLVLDTDNSPPVLTLDLLAVGAYEQPGYVPESIRVSTAVGYLAVSDPDTGANALVTCTSRNANFELQPLNENEYKVEYSLLLLLVLFCFVLFCFVLFCVLLEIKKTRFKTFSFFYSLPSLYYNYSPCAVK
jgi:hypothetical protein